MIQIVMDVAPACLIAHVAPKGASFAELHDIDQDIDLHPAEEALVAGSAPSRKREFAMGRACARQALADLGVGGAVLLRAPDGSAAWPARFCGAITHTKNYAAALAGPVALFHGLGVDAEQVGRVAPDLYPNLFSAAEMIELQKRDGRARDIAATLLFCAKEVAIKALRGMLEKRTPFTALQVRLGVAEFHVQAGSHSMTGRFVVEGDLAVAAAGLGAD